MTLDYLVQGISIGVGIAIGFGVPYAILKSVVAVGSWYFRTYLPSRKHHEEEIY